MVCETGRAKSTRRGESGRPRKRGLDPHERDEGIVHAVLLQPLPYAAPDRLVALNETTAESPTEQQPVSVPDLFDWQAQSRSFEALGAYHQWYYNLTGGGEPERITGGVMTANLLATVGTKPLSAMIPAGSGRPAPSPAA